MVYSIRKIKSKRKSVDQKQLLILPAAIHTIVTCLTKRATSIAEYMALSITSRAFSVCCKCHYCGTFFKTLNADESVLNALVQHPGVVERMTDDQRRDLGATLNIFGKSEQKATTNDSDIFNDG